VSFNRNLGDECLKEEIFDSLADAKREPALLRYDYNYAGPHSSLGNKTHVEARRALEQSEGSTPGALAQPDTHQYQTQGYSYEQRAIGRLVTRRLPRPLRYQHLS
jgi:putative transposase